MKKNLLRFATFAFLAAAVSMTSCSADKLTTKLLSVLAEQTNKQCPMPVDELTMLDSMTVEAPRTLHSFYTVGVPKDSLNMDLMDTQLKQVLITAAQNPQAEALRKVEVIFAHSYYDIDGELFYETEITPDMYNE